MDILLYLFFQKKWDKGKEMLVSIRKELENRGCLDDKQLERDGDFLIYLSMIHIIM